MMSSFDLLALVLCLTAIAGLYIKLPQRGKTGILAATLVATMMIAFASPVAAAAADDNVLSKGQEALNENLKTTPEGDQYQGIEYAQEKGRHLSDREITKRVQKKIPNDVKLSVSNGSVRLSGEVANRDKAQRIVQSIKEIPGVHEISYDLGLSS